jgi:ribonuclease P protein subunit POP4
MKGSRSEVTVTAENVLFHELTGVGVIIDDSTDPTLRGISGKILSETRNMLHIQDDEGRILRVAKAAATKIQVTCGSGVCFISGSSLIGKPEDRIARLN